MKFLDDCMHFIGDRPCIHARLCDGCPHYRPAEGQILIIKTAAAGDVLRTTTLLPGLARQKPGAIVVWLTAPSAAPLLAGNPYVHRIVPFDAGAYTALAPRDFDLIISLDKEPGPAGMATLLHAREKRGIGLGQFGNPVPFGPVAKHYFAIGLSDEMKFRENKKNYHELIAQAVDMPYSGDTPILNLSQGEIEYGREALSRAGWDGRKPVVGINTGAGESFANKMLSAVAILDVIDTLGRAAPGAFIALLGGPREKEKNRHIAHAAGGRAADTGCGHSMRGFAGIVSHCDVLLTGDTLAMHMAVALGRRVAAIFGPTCEQEINLFGRGKKLISPIGCSPCYKKFCAVSPNCMDLIEPKEVSAAIVELLG